MSDTSSSCLEGDTVTTVVDGDEAYALAEPGEFDVDADTAADATELRG